MAWFYQELLIYIFSKDARSIKTMCDSARARIQVYRIFSQVYNSKQHEMHVQNFKNFSMAITLQLDC